MKYTRKSYRLMRLLVTSEDSGCLKEIIVNNGTDTSIQSSQDLIHFETHMSQGLDNHIQLIYRLSSDKLLLGRSNGTLELVSYILNPKEPAQENLPKVNVNSFKVLSSANSLFKPEILESLNYKSKKRCELKDGFVSLYTLNDSEFIFAATRSGLFHFLKIQDEKLTVIQSHSVKAPLEFVQFYDIEKESNYVFGFGGEENVVKLAEVSNDFNSLKIIWEAKNVANDKLDLKVPIWPMGLRFLRSNDKSNNGDLCYQFVTITKYSHLRKYNTLHGRKPFESIDLLPNREPLTSLQIIGNVTLLNNIQISKFENFTIITTDTKKNIFQYDLKGRLLGKFGVNDITGCVSKISIAFNKYLLEGGLDRYVRVFDLKTRKLLCKVFTNGNVNEILMLDDKEIMLPFNSKNKKRSRKRNLIEEEKVADDLWMALEKRAKK